MPLRGRDCRLKSIEVDLSPAAQPPSLAADELGAQGARRRSGCSGATATSSAERSASRPARSIRSSSASPSASCSSRAGRSSPRPPAVARRGTSTGSPAPAVSWRARLAPVPSRTSAQPRGRRELRNALMSAPAAHARRSLPRRRRSGCCRPRAATGVSAMRAELATLDGPAERWRFALGCTRAAMLPSPTSRAAGRSLAVAGAGALVLAGEVALAGVIGEFMPLVLALALLAWLGRRPSYFGPVRPDRATRFARAGGYCLAGRVPDRPRRRRGRAGSPAARLAALGHDRSPSC